MSTRKRTILSAAQKCEICETKERKPNLSNTSIAQRYNIGKSTVTDILNEKERWLAISRDKESVDNALNTKQDIDGNILKTKAAFFAERFSVEDFHQSEGWLGGFKRRHGLHQFKKQGEASSAPSAESIENNRLALQQFLRSYNPEDIWNGDETSLFWKMEPSRVLACSLISGHKKEKSRVTIFCATNATGTEKIAFTFIHKHKTPRTMKNLNYKNLPVYYYWNKKAWMQVNETREKLDSVEVKFLPSNTTTALQPCDARIIHSFKCHYKRLFIQNRIDAYDNVQDGLVEMLADYNIFKALQNSAEAWSMVSSQTISNCWKKTGILPPNDEIEDDDSILDDFEEEEEAELERLIALLPEGDHLDAREYINIEDEMAAKGALTDDEIIDAVLNADKEEEMVINNDEFVPILEKVSLKKAEKSMDNMIRFLYEQGPEFGEVNDELRILKGLHKRVKLHLAKNLKQLNLHNFHDYIADNNVV
ncbi:tigger transposable element-derived protein 6-like [Rhizophagus clarus]|uniref:Tigger transposable element-derived protein 6-like n=1 Tax=Rhizophagus clarus TaxID=94130 RepID=A0A8H3QT18_9GLOM|nr:tigger transposable element-derived protein 6-like [Rhizophagus clarus]